MVHIPVLHRSKASAFGVQPEHAPNLRGPPKRNGFKRQPEPGLALHGSLPQAEAMTVEEGIGQQYLRVRSIEEERPRHFSHEAVFGKCVGDRKSTRLNSSHVKIS